MLLALNILAFLAIATVSLLAWGGFGEMVFHQVGQDSIFCLFKHWLHWPCPFCGLTRSFVLIAQGDLLGSFHYHLLGVPIYLLAVGFIFLSVTRPLWALGVVRLTTSRWGLYSILGLILLAWGIKLSGSPAYW